jgi:hypothetical protein
MLNEAGWLVPCLSHFTPGNDPVPIWAPGSVWIGVENLAPPLWFSPRPFQLVVILYTDYAVPAHEPYSWYPLRLRCEICIELFLYCNLLYDVLPCGRWLTMICKVLTHLRSLSLLLHSCCLAVPYIMYFLDTYRFANPAQNSSTVISSHSTATGICGDCCNWVECEPDSNGLL